MDRKPGAYVAGLTLLARRELSEKQLRQRLVRREHTESDIDAAIEKLKADRSLDDARVAGAIARYEILTRRHGRLRAQRRLEQAGIAVGVARSAVDEACASIDPVDLIGAALAKRLHGDRPIADEAEFGRLYRFLIGQGFEPEEIMRALRARRNGRT